MGFTPRIVVVALLMIGLGDVGWTRADTPKPKPKPVSEADVLKLIELHRQTRAILDRLYLAGIDFTLDDAVSERLRKAGVSEELLVALKALNRPPTKTITLDTRLGNLNCLAFSPDGKFVAVGGEGTSVEVWWVPSGGRRILNDHSGKIRCLAFSPDGKTLAVGSYKQVKLWNATTGKELATLKGHTTDLQAIFFLPDGKTLITAAWGEVKRWRLNSDSEPLTSRCWLAGWVLSPDGKRLAGYNDYWNNLGLVEGAALEVRVIPCRGIGCVAFSADSRTLVAGGAARPAVQRLDKGTTGLARPAHRGGRFGGYGARRQDRRLRQL
jgi:WD40 repeat protein